MNNRIKEYFIKSFYCAVYLKLCGFDPNRIEATQKNKKIFFYENSEELQNLIQDFYNNSILQNFIEKMIQFRKELYETKTN